MHTKLNTYKILKQNKIAKFTLFALMLTIIILYFLIPYITEKYTINTIINNTKNSVQEIKIIRSYYLNNMVHDIKKYAPNLKFDYDHWGENEKLPLPATMIHDLSKIFSEETGQKYNLYSEYPFPNRKDRVLTKFQKDAIKYTKESSNGIYTKRDNIDGVEVLRVASADYMTDKSCVNCHNKNYQSNWENKKWKIGEQIGVLEVITPIDEELLNHKELRNYIIFVLMFTGGSVLLYIFRLILNRETELLEVTGDLEHEVGEKKIELKNLSKLLDDHVISSKVNTKGDITHISQAFMDISGYSKEELLNHKYKKIRHPDMSKNVLREMWEVLKKGKIWRGEILNQKKDGSSFWVDDIVSTKYNSDGDIIGYNILSHDITFRKEATYLATHDHLTKLPNRAYFEDFLSHAINLAKRNKSILAVLFIDFDDFKNINDTFDHQTGDNMLILFSERLKSALRESDTVARIGGDEFTVLLENLTNQTDLLDSVNRIFEVLKEPIEIDSHSFHISISVGISVFPDDGDTMFDLMKHADHAMYHVKRTGKNNFKFYTKVITKKMKRRLDIVEALRKAIENDSFYLVFQPQYNISTKEVIGCEALVRMEDDNLGFVSPAEFIPIAEDNSFIVPIGELVLRKACNALSQWQNMGLCIDIISINISSIQLQEPNFINRLIQIVEESNLEPKNIDLELTEHTIMYHTEANIDMLGELRAKGFHITIDDFGTGYSSMGYLKQLPIDTIKIDKIFVDELHLDEDDVSITKAIIGLAHSLEYSVIAEGIELEEQEKILIDNNCIYGQGYLFSKGLIFDDFVTFVKENRKNKKVIYTYDI